MPHRNRGYRKYQRAQRRPAGPEQKSQQSDGFKGDVRCQKVRNRRAHPHAQCQRHQEEGEQRNDLSRFPVVGK